MKPWGNREQSSVSIRYMAKEVNLVMNPLLGRTCRLFVMQDAAPIAKDDAGEDVLFDQNANSFVDVDGPRMYRLVSNREIGGHELTLSTKDSGLALYAFTFVSCVVP